MSNLISKISSANGLRSFGHVIAMNGLMIKIRGLTGKISVGSKCSIITADGDRIISEVVALEEDCAVIMPFFPADKVMVGCRVETEDEMNFVRPSDKWLGRILNALGKPVDNNGILDTGEKPYFLRNQPVPAHDRGMVEGKIDLGVKCINTFTSCCKGQRMGIFAGSGVGKSVLMSMLTKYSDAEIKVIGLIGERGRELKEFLHNYLGEEGIKKAVIIAATSDESALMRRQAAYLTMCVAEYFRDQGKNVLCLMDSVTRFAMAQREIGLASGEPPTTRGYTPSVFAEMPKLLERAGPGVEGKSGCITGLFTVLVEGDDQNEPISDTVRGILDGHIVMDRKIGDRGRYPAVDILKSVSRTMPHCNTPEENDIVRKAKRYISSYEDMAEMIKIGAYRKGSDPELDRAIALYPKFEEFLLQDPKEKVTLEDGYKRLAEILEGK